jgi:prophage regulatory protein
MSNVILRRDEVERRTGYKHTTIYKKMADGEFPQSIRLGARAVGWVESEVEAWLKAKINARDGVAA